MKTPASGVQIEPAVDGFPEHAAVVNDRVTFSARALQPNTATRSPSRAASSIASAEAAGKHVASFGTGDGTPRLDVETGAWVVEASGPGIPRGRATSPRSRSTSRRSRRASSASCRASSTGGTRASSTSTKLGLKTKHVTVPVKGRKNHWTQVQIEPAKLLGRRGPARRPLLPGAARARRAGAGREREGREPRELLLNFTNLGVTAKLSGPSGLVWVTRLSDGQPQPGADDLDPRRQGQGPLARQDRRRRRRDDAGAGAAAPQGEAARINAATRSAAAGDGDGEGDGEEGDFAGDGEDSWAAAQKPTCWCSRAWART